MSNKLNFTNSELNVLLNDDFSCVKVQKGIKHIGLEAYYLSNVSKGVNETLNKIVSRYDRELKGILLTYKKPKVLHSEGTIHNDRGQIFLDVEAEFYLFCPEENKIVKAVVNKTGKDHVGCLIHKVFNISVPRSSGDENWIGRSVDIGDEILVKITFTDVFYVIPYIRGEIVKILNTKRKQDVEDDSGVSTSEDQKKRKKKRKEIDDSVSPKSKKIKIDNVEDNEIKSKHIAQDDINIDKQLKKPRCRPRKITITTDNPEQLIDDDFNEERNQKKENSQIDNPLIEKKSSELKKRRKEANSSFEEKSGDRKKTKNSENLNENSTAFKEMNSEQSQNSTVQKDSLIDDIINAKSKKMKISPVEDNQIKLKRISQDDINVRAANIDKPLKKPRGRPRRFTISTDYPEQFIGDNFNKNTNQEKENSQMDTLVEKKNSHKKKKKHSDKSNENSTIINDSDEITGKSPHKKSKKDKNTSNCELITNLEVHDLANQILNKFLKLKTPEKNQEFLEKSENSITNSLTKKKKHKSKSKDESQPEDESVTPTSTSKREKNKETEDSATVQDKVETNLSESKSKEKKSKKKKSKNLDKVNDTNELIKTPEKKVKKKSKESPLLVTTIDVIKKYTLPPEENVLKTPSSTSKKSKRKRSNSLIEAETNLLAKYLKND